MALIITPDLTDVIDVGRFLTQQHQLFRAHIHDAVNAGGDQLYKDALTALAFNLGVPEEAVAAGLDERLATAGLPSYTLIGSGVGVPYFVWRTQQDEKVCSICGPRDGQTYSREDFYELWPAHPNCRCRPEPVDLGWQLTAIAEDIIPTAMETVVDELFEGFTRGWHR